MSLVSIYYTFESLKTLEDIYAKYSLGPEALSIRQRLGLDAYLKTDAMLSKDSLYLRLRLKLDVFFSLEVEEEVMSHFFCKIHRPKDYMRVV